MKQVTLLFLFAAAVRATPLSLTVSSGSGFPGQVIQLPLNLRGSSRAAALQWTLTYPTADVSSISLSAGPAATAADKSLECGPNQAGAVICLVFGLNSNIIGTGAVAILHATLATSPSDEVIPLTLSALEAADRASNPIDVAGISGSITLRQVPELKTFWLAALGLLFGIGTVRRQRKALRY